MYLLSLERRPAFGLLLHLLVLLNLAVDALAPAVLLDALLRRLLELGRSLVVRVLEVERARDLVDELGEVLGTLSRDSFDVALEDEEVLRLD